MKRTVLFLLALLSISVIGCSSDSQPKATYRDFISDNEPVDNSKIEFGENFFIDLDHYFQESDPYMAGIDYEEYYSPIFGETLRLYEDTRFLYYSSLGAKLGQYYQKDDLFTAHFNSGGDTFLFHIEDDAIVNLDLLSISPTGFSFNGREFVHKEKEQPITSHYLYEYAAEPTYTIEFSLGEGISEEELFSKYHLQKYKSCIQTFHSYEGANYTSVAFMMENYAYFLDDLDFFCKLNREYDFRYFGYRINRGAWIKGVNLDYFSLSEDDAFSDYQYYGHIESFYYAEFKDYEDVDRIFASKQELTDFVSPTKDDDHNLSNLINLKNLANEVTDEMFADSNLLMTRVVKNSTAIVMPFDGLYYSNNELCIVLKPAWTGWFAMTQTCYLFFIPKSLSFQGINIYS